jgi:nicotinamidase-related amidase
MIAQFGHETALLVIDAQRGVNHHDHWGGSCGHRNNPASEDRIAKLLAAWRGLGRPVYFTLHNSREAASPLKIALDSGKPIPGLEPLECEHVVVKDVNSGFVGTDLEIALRRAGISRLVVVGYFTNMCVETTVRMAGNMGFDVYLAHDACAAGNRAGPHGQDFDAETVHRMAVANLHGEFCTAITSAEAIGLLAASNADLYRVQGNELYRGKEIGIAA